MIDEDTVSFYEGKKPLLKFELDVELVCGVLLVPGVLPVEFY